MTSNEETLLWQRLIACEEAIKKIPPQRIDNYRSEIALLKTEILNLKLLVTPLADIEARLKKLENSHSSLPPTITVPSLTKEGIKFTPEQKPKKWYEIISGK